MYIKSEKLSLKSGAESFGIKYTSEQKLFKNLGAFHFRSIFVQYKTFRDRNTTTWIGKHVPISVSNSSNFVEAPIFSFNSDPHHLVASFFLELSQVLGFRSKTKMKSLLLFIETILKNKLGNILEKLTQRQNQWEQERRFDMNQDDCENKNCACRSQF